MEGASCRSHEMRRLPWYGWLGAMTLLAGEVGVFMDIGAIRILFYCIAWWSYIFFVDAVVWKRRGYSLVRSRPREFWFLAFWSMTVWNLFELCNFRLQNWFYINVPTDTPFALILNLTAYATVLPGLFETYDLLQAFAIFEKTRAQRLRITPAVLFGSVLAGSGMLVAALVWPRYAFPLIWGFAALLGDPLCYEAGTRSRSLLRQLEVGDPRPILRLLLAGLICGALWEFWNYWAYTKWLYTVPFFEELKWFEMPPLGFLGFPPFALECYVLVNLINTLRNNRNWEAWDRVGEGASRWLAIPAIAGALLFNGLVYTGIDAWTVKSVAPTLAELKGAPDDTLEKLSRSGVTTPLRLLRQTATAEEAAALARASGVSQNELMQLREAARLVDLEGLGAANYNALQRLGVMTIAALAKQDPVALLPQWQAAVTHRRPTLPQVRLWVRAARRAAGPLDPSLSAS